MPQRPVGLYIHIPYCKSICRYCDFYSIAASRTVPDAYIQALLRDFTRLMPREADGTLCRPATVYFGGGTPGLLTPAQVERILQAVNPLPGAEITLEANPESALYDQLCGWRLAGVNRLSVGVQSAQDASLRRLGRLHTAQEARTALQNARKAGFTNISGDVMLALPGYTNAEFEDTLALLAGEDVTHISAYLLKIEPNTPFGKTPPPDLPEEDAAAEFYTYAAQRLQEAGYPRYEISNFAKPGFAARHNLLYWNCESWLGLGPAAHSCLAGRRFSFPPNLPLYLAGEAAPEEEGRLQADDYVMLQLRLAQGLNEAELTRRFGARLTLAQRGLLQRLVLGGLARQTDGAWALTSQGLLVQNTILGQLGPVET